MSDADWDADDFQPVEPAAKASNVNKWEGEDEEEEVKDNWEDDDNEEEKKDSEKPPEAPKSAASKKPKNNLAAKIQERERQQREEQARQQQLKNLTPAELQAEKIRQRKLQEESELELVKATYGVDSIVDQSSSGIDSANPSSKEEFDKLREAINSKVQDFSKAEPFVEFVTELVQSMVINLPVADLKKLSSFMTSLATEKAKMDKAATSKKKGGKYKGAKLKIDDRDLTTELEFDELDDFM